LFVLVFIICLICFCYPCLWICC